MSVGVKLLNHSLREGGEGSKFKTSRKPLGFGVYLATRGLADGDHESIKLRESGINRRQGLISETVVSDLSYIL